jgi:hypothetical protein
MEHKMDQLDVTYIPDHFRHEAADSLLATIRTEVKFQQYKTKYMGQWHPRPRLEAWYADWDYTYSGSTMPAKPMPPFLTEIIDRLAGC